MAATRFDRPFGDPVALVSRRKVLGGAAAGFVAVGTAMRAADGAGQRTHRDGRPANQPAAGDPLRNLLAIAVDLGDPPASADFASPAQRSLAFFADSAGQMAAVGVASPKADDRDPVTGAYDQDPLTFWHWANEWMPLPSAVVGRVDWLTENGWDATRIDQSLQVGTGADGVAIMRGRFELESLRAAWEQNGYEQVDIPGAVAYARSQIDDPALDDASRLVLAQLNNVAVLGAGTLIVASRLDRLQLAVDAAAGRAPALLDRPTVATVVEALQTDLAGAYLVPGSALRQQAAAGADPLPPVELAVIGITPGGPLPFARQSDQGTPLPFREDTPNARLSFTVLFADEASAAAAVSVVEARLATGDSMAIRRPFSALFATWTLRPVPGTPVVWIELTLQPDVPPKTWVLLVERGDLGFLAW